jgi:hypothetical protein
MIQPFAAFVSREKTFALREQRVMPAELNGSVRVKWDKSGRILRRRNQSGHGCSL